MAGPLYVGGPAAVVPIPGRGDGAHSGTTGNTGIIADERTSGVAAQRYEPRTSPSALRADREPIDRELPRDRLGGTSGVQVLEGGDRDAVGHGVRLRRSRRAEC